MYNGTASLQIPPLPIQSPSQYRPSQYHAAHFKFLKVILPPNTASLPIPPLQIQPLPILPLPIPPLPIPRCPFQVPNRVFKGYTPSEYRCFGIPPIFCQSQKWRYWEGQLYQRPRGRPERSFPFLNLRHPQNI